MEESLSFLYNKSCNKEDIKDIAERMKITWHC